METMTFIPTNNRVSPRSKKLNGREYLFIENINFILELIIRNTLKFNKLTSPEEIFESFSLIRNPTSAPDINIEMDVNTIENICDKFCSKNGILIKLVNKDECYYKLNNHNNV